MAIKQNQQAGYVLHTRPYSESSLLIDVFCRNHGRFMLLAKGARRSKRCLRGMVMPFKPLLISWGGRGQLPIMTSVEPAGFIASFNRRSLHSGYYINELILKLLHRFDEHARLFDQYDYAIRALAAGDEAASVLRVFEKKLLQETGFGLILDRNAETGEAIDHNGSYQYLAQHGPVSSDGNNATGMRIDGATLKALKDESFDSVKIKNQARALNRHVIYQQLDGKELKSRRVLVQILRYQKL